MDAMKIRSVSFASWCANHADDHAAASFRELYPWEVFGQLDYSSDVTNVAQYVQQGAESFVATVRDEFTGKNGRPNFLVHLKSTAAGRSRWEHRHWDDLFQLVATESGDFITLFTKKDDPSKVALRRFMGGSLASLEQSRSLPLSGLLFRSLIAYAAEDIFGPLKSASATRRKGDAAASDAFRFEPFLARANDVWILYSFTEEKAHRLGLRHAGAARSIVVIYCHPTFTKHHRCQDVSVRVLSLSEFLNLGSAAVRAKYLGQARFLINHLKTGDEADLIGSEADLHERLLRGKATRGEIFTSELREAKAGLGWLISTVGEAAYVLACANLLNAALNRNLHLYSGALRLEKNVYSFKAQLSRVVEQVVDLETDEVEVYVPGEGLTYARVRGVQFSFHAVPGSARMDAYASTDRNRPQTWSGLRLQPMAPAVLAWARAVLTEESMKIGPAGPRPLEAPRDARTLR